MTKLNSTLPLVQLLEYLSRVCQKAWIRLSIEAPLYACVTRFAWWCRHELYRHRNCLGGFFCDRNIAQKNMRNVNKEINWQKHIGRRSQWRRLSCYCPTEETNNINIAIPTWKWKSSLEFSPDRVCCRSIWTQDELCSFFTFSSSSSGEWKGFMKHS